MEFLIALGAGAILWGIGCLVAFFMTRRRQQGIPNWPTVQGTMIEAFVYAHTRQTTEAAMTTYTPTLAYAYTLAGTAYTASALDAAPYTERSYRKRARAEEIVRGRPVGSPVTVYYNPVAPSQTVLTRPRPVAHRTVLWYGIANILVGSGAVALGILLLA